MLNHVYMLKQLSCYREMLCQLDWSRKTQRYMLVTIMHDSTDENTRQSTLSAVSNSDNQRPLRKH
jgi:hypothetical protein